MKRIIEWIKKFFIDEEFNKQMERIESPVAKKKVEYKSCGPDDLESVFVKSLIRKGFTYNRNNKRWSRTWTTPTLDAHERTLEVYTMDSDGEWISMMYGNEGDIYYEQKVGKQT